MRRHGKVITVILGQLQFIFKDYLKNRRKVYTNTFLEQSDLSIWTKRTTNSSRDGSINRIYLDVLGNPEGFFRIFTNGGKIILSRQQISDLLSHSDNNLTIGLDKGTDNMLYELPSLLFTTPVVINRLDHSFSRNKYNKRDISYQWSSGRPLKRNDFYQISHLLLGFLLKT